jgi:RNA polymerase sigma factor (TIGR02999 family)
MASLTALIRRAHQGDAAARNEVFSQLYGELAKLARSRLARSGRSTLLDTSALVNEAYLRLSRAEGVQAEDRHRYLAYASRAMRSVIVDHVRARAAERRGGGALRVTLNTEVSESVAADETELLRIDEALRELALADERAARVVEMRYFGGLTEEEIARALGVSDRTVRRAWEKGRLLLATILTPQ